MLYCYFPNQDPKQMTWLETPIIIIIIIILVVVQHCTRSIPNSLLVSIDGFLQATSNEWPCEERFFFKKKIIRNSLILVYIICHIAI
jgi:hypothetical protein